MIGILIIFNGIMVFKDLIQHYMFMYVNRFDNYNHKIWVLKSVNKYKFRTGFFHGEKECIICWEDFKNK